MAFKSRFFFLVDFHRWHTSKTHICMQQSHHYETFLTLWKWDQTVRYQPFGSIPVSHYQMKYFRWLISYWECARLYKLYFLLGYQQTHYADQKNRNVHWTSHKIWNIHRAGKKYLKKITEKVKKKQKCSAGW